MTITIDSWGQLLGLILSGVAVLGIVATIHWTMFAAPLLKKMISPLSHGLAVTSRVVKEKHPVEFERADIEMRRESELWGGA